MKTNYKKVIKLITLLITSILIGTASAYVYRYMYIEGSITVGKPLLIWLEGEDLDSTIVGNTVTINLNVENGTAMNFTRALYLKNNATSAISVSYNITVLTALYSSEFEIAKIHIYENYTTPGTWTYLDTIDLTDSSDHCEGVLGQGKYLRFTIEVKAIKEVGRNFKVQVEYWTQS
jgi:hypothetical protein